MIATERFVFLHLHKSGGSFVNECLVKFVPGAQHIGYHLPRPLIPRAYAELPVLGFVRNPWSYYVSWYHFQKGHPRPNALFRILSEDGRLDFESTVANMLTIGTDDGLLDRILAVLPPSYSNRGLNLPAFALAPIRGTGLGFYGYLYRYLYGEIDDRVRIGRMEHLREELLELMAATGQHASAALRAYVHDAGPSNASEHVAYTEYYGPKLRELVRRCDAEIVDRHRYSFGA